MTLIPSTQKPSLPVTDEHILVVQRTVLFPTTAWQGLQHSDMTYYLDLIKTHQEFLPRTAMESDPTYKQIIPYLIFKHIDRYFLMQRQSHASEKRLQNKFSLGIGGHVRHEDLQAGSTLFDWARREFHEEIAYQDAMTITPLGILNDDSNAVGQVHLGLVLLIQGTSDTISIKSELKSGRLVTLSECYDHWDNLESWSQIVVKHLMRRTP